MSLVSPARVRTFIEGLKPSDDAKLEQLLDWADSALASWLQFPIPSGGTSPTLEATTYVDYLDGPLRSDADTLRLTVRPVSAVDEIVDDEDWLYGSDAEVDSSEWMLDTDAGAVYLRPSASHTWSRWRRAIRVTYTAGWTASTLPKDLESAIVLFVREHWRAKTLRGVPSAAAEDTVELPELVPPMVQQLLSRYRIWEAGLA